MAEFVNDTRDVESNGKARFVERPPKDSRDLVEAVDERVAVDVEVLGCPRGVECVVPPDDQRGTQRLPFTVDRQRCADA